MVLIVRDLASRCERNPILSRSSWSAVFASLRPMSQPNLLCRLATVFSAIKIAKKLAVASTNVTTILYISSY